MDGMSAFSCPRGETCSELAALRQELEQQKEIQMQLRLETFIYNDEHSGRASEELRTLYGVDFCSDWFVMLLFGPEQRSIRSQTFKAGIPMHELRQLLMPILCQRGNFCFFPLRDATACVANLRLSRGQTVKAWLDDMTGAITFLMEEKKLAGMRCAVGQALQGSPNIQQLNRTVQIVWDHSQDQAGQLHSWHRMDWASLEVQNQDGTLKAQPLPLLERQFMQHVNNRQFYEAVSVLDEITNRRIWQTRAPLAHIRSSVFFRLESVLSTCGVSINPADTRTEVYDKLEQLSRSQDFRELRTVTYDVFALLDDLINKEEAKTKKSRLIRSYIEENYSNPGLDAAMICEYYKLSEVYLSRVFKEAYQISWLDYVHTVRLDHAKELLETTDRKIDDIAEAVGFTTRTMARLFKQAEGMPPGAYRAALQAKSQTS